MPGFHFHINSLAGDKEKTGLDWRWRNVRFSCSYLACWSSKENGDRKGDGAADKNKPWPGNLRPPIRHEPSETPLRTHEFSVQQRKNIKGRHGDLAQHKHGHNPDYHGDNISAVGAATPR